MAPQPTNFQRCRNMSTHRAHVWSWPSEGERAICEGRCPCMQYRERYKCDCWGD